MSLHQFIHMPGSEAPRGYSDGATVAPGCRFVVLGGHVAFDSARKILHPHDLVLQLGVVLRNLKATLRAAGAGPEHLVKLNIYTTDVPHYRAKLRELGAVWKQELGCTYPAMTLIGVAALFDVGAMIEIEGTAAVPTGE